jgi:hypothetical protein
MATVSELRAIRSNLVAALKLVDTLLEGTPKSNNKPTLDITKLERTKAIEWVLTANGGVMRPIEIWAELTRLGRHDPKMEVQVTTFDLWDRKRIDKVGRGQYKAKAAS